MKTSEDHIINKDILENKDILKRELNRTIDIYSKAINDISNMSYQSMIVPNKRKKLSGVLNWFGKLFNKKSL